MLSDSLEGNLVARLMAWTSRRTPRLKSCVRVVDDGGRRRG